MDCPTIQLIRLMGKKWTFVVLQEISIHGDKGFNLINRRMRISPKMLAQRIKELERANVISRESAPLPLNSKYALTPRGKELFDIFCQLRSLDGPGSGITCAPECTSCPYYEQAF